MRRQAEGGMGAADGIASLHVVECLARATRAERQARRARADRLDEGYRRLVRAVLEVDVAVRSEELTAPAGVG